MKTNHLSLRTLLFSCLIITSFGPTVQAQSDGEWNNTPFEIKSIEASQALVIKADVPMAEIGEKMSALYGELFTYLESRKITPTGPPFAVYYSWEPEGNVIFEVGVPVSAKVKTSGNVEYRKFESMQAVSTLYTGAYENLEPVYNKLMAYMQTEDLESTGISWEVYLTDPQEIEDQNLNKTLIYFPIK